MRATAGPAGQSNRHEGEKMPQKGPKIIEYWSKMAFDTVEEKTDTLLTCRQ
jgi:hypothetical protein